MFDIESLKFLQHKKEHFAGKSLAELISKLGSYDPILSECEPTLQKNKAWLFDCILFRCYKTNGWKEALLLAEPDSELEKVCCENIDLTDINKHQATIIMASPETSKIFIFDYSLN